MKYFGTVKAFDEHIGNGSITQETGSADLNFERSALMWDSIASPPTAGQRISYDIGATNARQPCAVNLQTI